MTPAIFAVGHARLLPFLSVANNLHVVGRNVGLGRDDLAGCIDERPTPEGNPGKVK